MATVLRGLDQVVNNLNKEIAKLKLNSVAGLIDAGITIRRDMDKTPPLIPIEMGNLRASWFIATKRANRAYTKKPSFKGSKASQLSQEHEAVVGEAIGEAKKYKAGAVVMGFTANYASIVHYSLGDKVWTRPQSGPLFFQRAVERNYNTILKSIQKKAKIK